jgi:hypothetical protein
MRDGFGRIKGKFAAAAVVDHGRSLSHGLETGGSGGAGSRWGRRMLGVHRSKGEIEP